VVNNYYINDANVYNLHKIDTKFDYNPTSKLRLSARYGYQPYYNFLQPIYGPILGGTSAFSTAGAGNYLQHGAGLAIAASGSYVVSPTFVIDATWGKTSSHQILMPNLSNVRYGLDVLGIPDFAISNFVTMGASYPALEYFQPLYEFTANATKIKGSHTIRFGRDINFQHMRHIEDRNNTFTFNGSATTVNGAPERIRTMLSAAPITARCPGLAAFPDFAQARLDLASVLMASGERSQAIEELREVARGKDPAAARVAADALRRSGEQ
jgi:hypothetical protein